MLPPVFALADRGVGRTAPAGPNSNGYTTAARRARTPRGNALPTARRGADRSSGRHQGGLPRARPAEPSRPRQRLRERRHGRRQRGLAGARRPGAAARLRRDARSRPARPGTPAPGPADAAFRAHRRRTATNPTRSSKRKTGASTCRSPTAAPSRPSASCWPSPGRSRWRRWSRSSPTRFSGPANAAAVGRRGRGAPPSPAGSRRAPPTDRASRTPS